MNRAAVLRLLSRSLPTFLLAFTPASTQGLIFSFLTWLLGSPSSRLSDMGFRDPFLAPTSVSHLYDRHTEYILVLFYLATHTDFVVKQIIKKLS